MPIGSARSTLEPMTALEQLGAFVANHQPDERVRSGVRLHVADLIGAWIAACGTAEGRALMAFRKDADALADRVAVNVALARLSEIDDIHLAAMITPGAIVVPSALTIAASLPDVTQGDLTAAIAVGLRGHDPARRRDRRPERALSRHLAELFRRALRRRRGCREIAQARRDADRERAFGGADHGGAGHRPSRGCRPRCAGSRWGMPPAAACRRRWRRAPDSPPT